MAQANQSLPERLGDRPRNGRRGFAGPLLRVRAILRRPRRTLPLLGTNVRPLPRPPGELYTKVLLFPHFGPLFARLRDRFLNIHSRSTYTNRCQGPYRNCRGNRLRERGRRLSHRQSREHPQRGQPASTRPGWAADALRSRRRKADTHRRGILDWRGVDHHGRRERPLYRRRRQRGQEGAPPRILGRRKPRQAAPAPPPRSGCRIRGCRLTSHSGTATGAAALIASSTGAGLRCHKSSILRRREARIALLRKRDGSRSMPSIVRLS